VVTGLVVLDNISVVNNKFLHVYIVITNYSMWLATCGQTFVNKIHLSPILILKKLVSPFILLAHISVNNIPTDTSRYIISNSILYGLC